ncbi:MAG: transcriptional regulator MarR family [Chloroflexi bacterium]|jgi:DNA-binding MarR family transcriptional regulator|nr:transcriptional regulator MarR family [Chloroflexota bacterium]
MENLDENLLEMILDLDSRVTRRIRAGWPGSWMQVTLPPGHIRALFIIEAGGARTPREVASLLQIGRTSVTGLLDRLEMEGLLTRSIDQADKRSFILDLTAKGKAMVQQIDDIRRQQVRNGLVLMGKSDLVALRTGLAALSTALSSQTLPVNLETEPED